MAAESSSGSGATDDQSLYMMALGVLHRNWLNVDRAMEHLLWHYMSVDQVTGEAITAQIESETRSRILSSLVKLKEKNAETLEAVEQAIECYKAFRKNRNYLAFGQLGSALDRGSMTLRVMSPGRVVREKLPVSLSRMHAAADRRKKFQLYLSRLHNHLRRGEPLPEPFPRPPELLSLLRQDRNGSAPDRRPPSSPEA